MRIVDAETVAKFLRKLERVHAKVCADNCPPPAHPKKIGHLAGAATDFENTGAVGQLLVEHFAEYPRPGPQTQAVSRIQIIAIWERRFFIKLLDDIGDVARALRPFVGGEQAWSIGFHWENVSSMGAGDLVLRPVPRQRGTVYRAAQPRKD